MLPILLAVALVIVLFTLIVLGQSDEFVVSRSIQIAATPENVFPHVNHLKQWDAWSPWAKLDPNARNSFAGPESGPGAAMSWVGNKKVGEGKMTITESRPAQRIRLKIDFIKPFAGTSDVEFTFTAEENQTLVVWSMAGKNNFFSKVFSLFVDCERMVGRDYEKGLTNLKSVVESA